MTVWRVSMSLYRDTYAVVNLKYLKQNVEMIYQKFKRPLMAVMLMVMVIKKLLVI